MQYYPLVLLDTVWFSSMIDIGFDGWHLAAVQAIPIYWLYNQDEFSG